MKMIYKEQKRSVCAPDKIPKMINTEEARRDVDGEKAENAESKVAITQQAKEIESNADKKFIAGESGIPSAEEKQETDQTGAVPIVQLKEIEKCEKIAADTQIPVESVKQETKLEDVTKKTEGPNELLITEAMILALAAEKEKNKPDTFSSMTTEQPKRVDDSKKFLISESNSVHKIFYGNTLADAIPILSLSIKEGKLDSDTSEFVVTVQPKKLRDLQEFSIESIGEEQEFSNDEDSSEFVPIPAMSAEEEKQEPDKFEIMTPSEKEEVNILDEISIAESMGEIEYNCLNRYIIMICSWNDYVAPVVFSIPILLVGACSFACGAFLPCASRVF